ncbi:MAG: DUF4912 domain-containing protein [Cyanobacteria bacterium NC_groundwater_1444_Ag_S-0.65um_54_12]|nr:DUF4912 domain-containing protein [Cyanobacteria bacterium NC_groundwater_1444_Ag_S-0.65um_54_12]
MDKRELDKYPKKELVEMARKKGIKGFSTMSKEQLVQGLLAKEPPSAKQAKHGAGAAKASKRAAKARTRLAAEVVAVVPAVGQKKPGDSTLSVVARSVAVAEVPAGSECSAGKPAGPDSMAELKLAASANSSVNGNSGEVEPAMALPVAADQDRTAVNLLKPAEQEIQRARVLDVPAAHAIVSEEIAVPQLPRFKQTAKNDELLSVDEGLGELPGSYDENRAILLVRDPAWSYVYWDLSRATFERAQQGGDWRQLLRVQELSGPEGQAAYFFDVTVPREARSWYLRLPGDGRRYRVEVGLQQRGGGHILVAVSNAVETPRGQISEQIADQFITLPDDEEKLLGAKAAPQTALPPVVEWRVPEASTLGMSSTEPPPAPVPLDAFAEGYPVPAEGWAQQALAWRGAPWSGAGPWAPERPASQPGRQDSSWGSHAVGSWSWPGASEARLGPQEKDFWLVADAELIVYGATEPDAKVTLRGQQIKLRPDGTFSFRFYLPNGQHPIPIRAINAAADDERMITITVSRETRGDGKVNLLE